MAADHPTSFMYCNQVQGATSLWDVLLNFQRVAVKVNPADMTSQVSVAEEVQMAMSPGHAKAMLATLWENVEAFEKTAGKIGLDKTSQAKFEEFVRKVKAS